jgi:hypothetical protein
MNSTRKIYDILVNKEGFSKLSTDEFPVFTSPVEFLNRSGTVSGLASTWNTWKDYAEETRNKIVLCTAWSLL